MKKTLAALAATAVLLPASLSGCAMPTSAAEVDGTRITMAQVEQMCPELKKIDDRVGAGCEQTVTRWLVRGEIADKAAESLGIAITESDLDTLRKSAPDFTKIEAIPTLKPLAMAAFRWGVVSEKAAAGADKSAGIPVKLATFSATLDTKINPRLGVWDPKKLDVIPAVASFGEPYLPAGNK